MAAQYELSIRQYELLAAQLADAGTCALNVGTFCEIHGALDTDCFRAAIERVVAGFDALRTVLRAGVEHPSAERRDTMPPPLVFAEVGCAEQARAWIARDMQQPFAIYDSPLYRFALLRISAEQWVFYAGFHHLLVDGWAMGLVTERALAEYDALGDSAKIVAPYAGSQVLVHALTSYAASQAFTKDAAFWRARFADHPGLLLRKLQEPVAGARAKQVVVPVTLSRATLTALCERAGVGRDAEAPVLLALLYGFFGRAATRDDVVFGLSLLNRRGSEELNAAGLAVSAVPLRVRGGFAQDLAGTVRAIAQEMRNVYRHHRFPLGEMTRLYAQDRSGAGGLFDIAVSLLAKPYGSLKLHGAVVGRQTQVFSSDAQLPLQVFVDSHDADLPVFIDFVCDTAYFSDGARAWLAARFQAYAEALVTAPSLGAASRIDAAERRLLLTEWNKTASHVPFVPLHARVAHWAVSTPQRAALVMGTQRVTYAELDRRAAMLGARLAAHGVALEHKVGVLLPRGIEVPLALLAIHHVGGVYVPLDPDAPPDRLRYVLADADVRVLLTTRDLAVGSGDLSVATVLHLDSGAEQADVPPSPRGGPAVAPGNLAYVIYTSGSTGKPKGVGLTHGGLSNLSHALAHSFGIAADSAVLQFARACFDASVFETAAAFANGATLHPVDSSAARAPDMLAGLLVGQGITMATLPPSLLPALARHHYPKLETLVVAGEACSAETAEEWRTRCRLINAYGPTETTVCATFAVVDAGGIPAIGRPLENTQAYVLDAALEPVPCGESGMLYVGGDGLARGYVGRAGLSAEQFIADPFGAPGGRLYRTGDLVRQRADGAFEFLGRVDQQIKLRGFRIELGEIEAALRACADVADAVVTSHRRASGEATLVAYCVAHSGELPLASLRAQLAASLPDYMMPAQLIQLAALPLNANGKIDRNALPAPNAATDALRTSGNDHRSGSVEASLEAIWAQLLNLPRVGIDQQFFEVGGSSLLLGQVLQAIEARLGVKLEIIDLIKHSTIRSLAQHVHTLLPTQAPGARAAPSGSLRARGGLAAALGLRK